MQSCKSFQAEAAGRVALARQRSCDTATAQGRECRTGQVQSCQAEAADQQLLTRAHLYACDDVSLVYRLGLTNHVVCDYSL